MDAFRTRAKILGIWLSLLVVKTGCYVSTRKSVSVMVMHIGHKIIDTKYQTSQEKRISGERFRCLHYRQFESQFAVPEISSQSKY